MQHNLTIPALVMGLMILAACDDKPQQQGAGSWGTAAKVVTQHIELQPLIDEIQALGTARATES